MSKMAIDVAIVGAGPYGLSLASHLRHRGIDFRIFGEPMESWKKNMPPGMLLKSYPWASNLSDPENRLSVKNFFTEQSITYDDTRIPVPLGVFIAYGDTFQRRLVPMVERKKLVSTTIERSLFCLRFDDEETVYAKRVIVAVGVVPFAHIPAVADHLPAELISHSSDYGSLGKLDGKSVIIAGSGASATDLAALLHERGTDVSLLMRANQLNFAGPPPLHRSLFERVKAPDSGIGYGWKLQVYASAPWLINRTLSEIYRVKAAHTRALVALGGAFMRDRVIGKVPLLLGQTITGLDRRGSKLDVRLNAADGRHSVVTADHIIFATGYLPVDVNRLGFLDQSIRDAIGRCKKTKAPNLSLHYESLTVPGLHFIGPASMHSFGPVLRFVFGTPHPARHLARYLARGHERVTENPEFAPA